MFDPPALDCFILVDQLATVLADVESRLLAGIFADEEAVAFQLAVRDESALRVASFVSCSPARSVQQRQLQQSTSTDNGTIILHHHEPALAHIPIVARAELRVAFPEVGLARAPRQNLSLCIFDARLARPCGPVLGRGAGASREPLAAIYRTPATRLAEGPVPLARADLLMVARPLVPGE